MRQMLGLGCQFMMAIYNCDEMDAEELFSILTYDEEFNPDFKLQMNDKVWEWKEGDGLRKMQQVLGINYSGMIRKP